MSKLKSFPHQATQQKQFWIYVKYGMNYKHSLIKHLASFCRNKHTHSSYGLEDLIYECLDGIWDIWDGEYILVFV